MAEIMRFTPTLQKAVVKGKLKDKDNVMNWVMSQVYFPLVLMHESAYF